jgi:GNAT superfamily N-acetyltransferase
VWCFSDGLRTQQENGVAEVVAVVEHGPMATVDIRLLTDADVEVIPPAFAALGWPGKSIEQYRRYLREQSAGERLVLVALADGVFAGYVTVHWVSAYPPFREGGFPEIQDFNVLPDFRRRGIGTALMDAAEKAAAQRTDTVGIGVGLYADYGSAQRMYARRGYIPDGRGVNYRGVVQPPGTTVRLDDDLILMMTRRLT